MDGPPLNKMAPWEDPGFLGFENFSKGGECQPLGELTPSRKEFFGKMPKSPINLNGRIPNKGGPPLYTRLGKKKRVDKGKNPFSLGGRKPLSKIIRGGSLKKF